MEHTEERQLVQQIVRIVSTRYASPASAAASATVQLDRLAVFVALVKTELHEFELELPSLDKLPEVLLILFLKWKQGGDADKYADKIKKCKKCVELVKQAQEQYQEYLQFQSLLAECDRKANIGGNAVLSSSRSSTAGATKSTSLLDLRRDMAVRVRSKLLDKARAAVDIVDTLQDERVKLRLKQQYNQLAQTDQGWKRAWGIVDRALSGMKCFCGDDEMALLRCFHSIQDLWFEPLSKIHKDREEILNLQPDKFDWESGRVGISMRKMNMCQKSLELQSTGDRKDVLCVSTIPSGARARELPKTYQVYKDKPITTNYGEVYFGTLLTEDNMFHGVYRPTHLSTGQVIIKCTTKDKITTRCIGGQPIQEDPLNELAALRLVTSSRPKYVPCFREVAQDYKRIIKIEDFGGDELFEILQDSRQRKMLTQQNIQILFKQLIFAVEHLHAYGIAHLDISLENVIVKQNIVTKNLHLSLIDMGLSRRIPRDLATGHAKDFPAKSMAPTPKLPYLDPPIFNGRAFNGELADVYACGSCLFILLTTFKAFERPHEGDRNFRILRDRGASYLIKAWAKNTPPSAMDLVDQIYQPDRRRRLSIAQIRQHPYLNHPVSSSAISQSAAVVPQLQSVRRTKFVRQQEILNKLIFNPTDPGGASTPPLPAPASASAPSADSASATAAASAAASAASSNAMDVEEAMDVEDTMDV